MIRKSLQGFKQLIKVQYFSMSVSQGQGNSAKAKSYRMPTKTEEVPYRTQHPLRLHNYRILLYANKQNLFTPALRQMVFAIPSIVMIYLIKNNPWYLTFPASLPIMLGLQFYIFYRWIIHKKHNKFIVERVYLYQTNTIEFVFSSKIRRKFKAIQNSHEFPSPFELIKPKQGDDGQIEWKERGFPFPTKLIYKKNQVTNQIECFPPMMPLTYGWTKYCQNFQNYIFPKDYQYANWQLLVHLFNGRYIDFENSINQIEQELPEGEDYYSLQQQLKWIKEDEAKNQQYRKQQIESQKQ